MYHLEALHTSIQANYLLKYDKQIKIKRFNQQTMKFLAQHNGSAQIIVIKGCFSKSFGNINNNYKAVSTRMFLL